MEKGQEIIIQTPQGKRSVIVDDIKIKQVDDTHGEVLLSVRPNIDHIDIKIDINSLIQEVCGGENNKETQSISERLDEIMAEWSRMVKKSKEEGIPMEVLLREAGCDLTKERKKLPLDGLFASKTSHRLTSEELAEWKRLCDEADKNRPKNDEQSLIGVLTDAGYVPIPEPDADATEIQMFFDYCEQKF